MILGFDGRFLNQHDRDIPLGDRISSVAGSADEASSVRGGNHLRLADGTGQDLEQLGIDGDANLRVRRPAL